MWQELPSASFHFGDEGDRVPLLRRDLLGAVLVDRVVVRGAQGRAVEEVDLVLAEVALALRVLDRHLGARHLVADPANQRFDASRAEQRVVDVVEVRRLEVAVALVPGVLIRGLEDDELELRSRVADQTALGEPVELAAQDLARRCDHVIAIGPAEVGHHEDGRRVPGNRAKRVEVRLHLEVAVAALPRGHLVSRDRLHVDVDREEVVTTLRPVFQNRVEEVGGGQALALKPPLHVRDREQHGVHRAVRDRFLQLVELHLELRSLARRGGARRKLLVRGRCSMRIVDRPLLSPVKYPFTHLQPDPARSNHCESDPAGA